MKGRKTKREREKKGERKLSRASPCALNFHGQRSSERMGNGGLRKVKRWVGVGGLYRRLNFATVTQTL